MTSRRLAVGLVLLAGLISPQASIAAEKAIWGPLTLPNGNSAFPTYERLGVDTIQSSLNWRAIAPQRPADPANPADPAYAWPADVDSAVAQAGPAGINVALLVAKSPGWANGGRSALHGPNPADYATFLAAASRRYPSVRRWMIWGEPNRIDRFLPNKANSRVGPRAYAKVLDAAYGALKAVSRRNIVIGGMTWTGGDVKPAPFLRYMRLPNGQPPRLDWYGHNPFPFRFPNLRELAIAGGYRDISDMDVFARQLHRTYSAPKRLWLSEFDVQSDNASKTFELFVSRREQAQWLRAAYRLADSLPAVAGLGWLSLLDRSEAAGNERWGLLTARGAAKPAFWAYLRAPAVRFRPRVRVPRRIAAGRVRRRGLLVRIRLRIAGRLQLELRRRRVMVRVSRHSRAGQTERIRLRVGRRLLPGRYQVVVRAPRSESVRRTLTIR